MRVVYRHIVLKYQSLRDMAAYTFRREGPYVNMEARYISTATLNEMIEELEKHGYIESPPPDANL